jgi:AcrR family transcriptional regulator
MKSENHPRKRPRQARAQATVEAILEATVQILDREGLDAATTTRIAEVAGVSIGSLYQYFSHRDAILNALQDREFERALTLMGEILVEGNLNQNPRAVVTAVVRGLAKLYRAAPGLHRVLTIEGLRVAMADHVHAFDLRVVGIVRQFLAASGATIRRRNVDAAAFVAFQSVRAIMLSCLLERPPGLDEDALVVEVVDLVMRYLVADEESVVVGDAGGQDRPLAVEAGQALDHRYASGEVKQGVGPGAAEDVQGCEGDGPARVARRRVPLA